MSAPYHHEQTHLPGISRRAALGLGAGAFGAALTGLSAACGRVPLPRVAPPNPFVKGGRPLLVAVEGEDLGAMLRAGCEALGGLDRLLPLGREALLKGNYVAQQAYPVTTAPDFILAVAGELARAGFHRSTLFEAQGTRLVRGHAPEDYMGRMGVLERVRAGGVDVHAADFLDRDAFRLVRNPSWSIDSPVAVHRALHDAGVIISLPVLKRHHEARLTCALKMHFGSVLLADRLVAHKNSSAGKQEFFDHRLVHFADAVKPQLNVVDVRALLARSGPALGGGAEVIKGVNRIVLCGDMVATDVYCARLMARYDDSFAPAMIAAQLRQAADLGLGTANLDAVEIVELRV